MFEIGKRYSITTGQGDDIGYSTSRVIAWECPLLKIETPTGVLILNTSAATFISAELQD